MVRLLIYFLDNEFKPQSKLREESKDEWCVNMYRPPLVIFCTKQYERERERKREREREIIKKLVITARVSLLMYKKHIGLSNLHSLGYCSQGKPTGELSDMIEQLSRMRMEQNPLRRDAGGSCR